MLTVGMGASLLVSACSKTTRYRVLAFFFDGVPDPASASRDSDGDVQETGPAAPDTPVRRAVAKKVFHSHPPYWESRCGTCHKPDDGQLFRTPEEGLCQSCHSDLPGEARYVHGPVVVNACLFCHHYHRSVHPRMLLDDVKVICLGCHEGDGLIEGPHHAASEEKSCVECHDPHGGDNRFFLKT